LVTVQVGFASRFAAYWESSGVERALQLRRAIRAQVDRASSGMAADIIVDRHRQIGTINKTNIVEVITTALVETELCDRCWRDTSAGVRVAKETAVTPSGETGVRSWVGAEVTVATTPDSAGVPVVGNGERHRREGCRFPTRGEVRDGSAGV